MKTDKAMKALRKARQVLWEILYPEGAFCLACGKVSSGECLCPECRQELQHSDMLESWEYRDLQGVPAWSIRPHQGIPRKLVLRLKHGAESRAAEELAGLLRDRPASFPVLSPDTVVTWVPTPKRRSRERCIDHGQKLAEAMARELGLSCRQLLQRQGNDTPQARLNREERQKNLRKAFVPREKIREPVLLVDDVLTTGTTASRCIAALREAGAKEIMVLTATHSTYGK